MYFQHQEGRGRRIRGVKINNKRKSWRNNKEVTKVSGEGEDGDRTVGSMSDSSRACCQLGVCV